MRLGLLSQYLLVTGWKDTWRTNGCPSWVRGVPMQIPSKLTPPGSESVSLAVETLTGAFPMRRIGVRQMLSCAFLSVPWFSFLRQNYIVHVWIIRFPFPSTNPFTRACSHAPEFSDACSAMVVLGADKNDIFPLW